MNIENQTLKAIQTSKAYYRKQLKKETNPHTQQKIQHYLKELEKEELKILNQNKKTADKYTNLKDTILE